MYNYLQRSSISHTVLGIVFMNERGIEKKKSLILNVKFIKILFLDQKK